MGKVNWAPEPLRAWWKIPAGALVAGATVKVSNNETGLVRQLVSGECGRVPAPPCPRESTGWSRSPALPRLKKEVVVNVGATATLKLALQVGDVAQTLTVREAADVDTAQTDVSSLVDRDEIRNLPINGRRYYDFALLTPGVARDGRFGLLSFRGASGNFDNYMVEGNDDNQAYFSENRGRYRAPSTLSANAVQEFQVGQGAYQAEFGRATGGSVNMVLRSGANALHADGFYYYRDQDFAARDPLASIKPPERRQQLGGSVSGPIRSNKLFYFVNYDQQMRNFPLVIEDLTNALDSGKPTLPANPTPAQGAVQRRHHRLQCRPRFRPQAVSQWRHRQYAIAHDGEQYRLGKLDYQINDSNTLSMFFNYMRSHGERAIQTPIVLGNVGRNGTDDVRIDSYNARLTSTFGSRRVNELRFQWSRDFEYEIGDQPPPETYANGSGNFSFGLATFLQRYALPDERRTAVRGQFLLHRRPPRLQVRRRSQPRSRLHRQSHMFGGTYTYPSTLALGRDLVTPGAKNYTNFLQDFGLSRYAYSTIDYALFIQDQWKPISRLTINYGVRWDKQTMPEPFAPESRDSRDHEVSYRLAQLRPAGRVLLTTLRARAAPCCAAAMAFTTGAFPTGSSRTRCRTPV